MAGEVPVYRSSAPTAGLGQVQPLDIVGGERTAAATAQLGATVSRLGAEFQSIGREVDLTTRKTRFLEGVDALHQEADKNPDYATAPEQFQQKARALADQTFKGVAPSDRAALDLWATGRTLTGLGEVRRQSLTKQQSQFTADVATQSAEYLKRFDGAATDVERAATKADFFGFLDDGVKRGMVGAAQAQAYKASFTTSGVGVQVQRRIADDPGGALADLADPTKYPDLDPETRQRAVTQARQANDERQTLRLQNQALQNPVGALATVGRASPSDAAQIFERGIAPVEGGVATGGGMLRRYLAEGKDASHADNLRGGFAAKVAAMLDAAPPEIRDAIRIGSGARSTERQAQLYAADVARNGGTPSGYVAAPGHSNHEAGGAADLLYDGAFRPTSEKGRAALAWAHANAGNFGLDFRLMREKGASVHEPWHIEEQGGPSGGDGPVGLVSSQGAYGRGQLLPATAREMAQKLASVDASAAALAGMSDADLKKTLLTDHALNTRLGRAYLAEGLQKTEGSIPAAIAYYHAGPKVLPFYEEAKKRFGDNFTAEQFASVLPASMRDANMSTADYVRAVYGRMEGRTGGAGLSVNGSYRAATLVDARLTAERAEQAKLLQGMISAQAGERDQTIKNLWDGYRIDGPALAAMRAPLMQSASAGNADAAAQLRKLAYAEAAAPAIAQARAMNPGELTAALDREEQSFQISPPGEFQATRHKAMRAVAEANAKHLTEFPTEILRGQGVAPVVPLDAGASAGDAGFAAALGERGRQADYATKALPGAALKVFSPEEASAFKARMAQGSDEDRVGLLGTMKATLSGGAYRAAVDQVFGDDPSARVAGRLASADIGLARDVLRGAKLLDLPEMKDKGPELREAIKRTMPRDLWPDVATQDDAIRGAMAVYAAERGRQGLLYETPDRAGMERAMSRVAGEFTTRGGKQVAAPRGMPLSAFNGALNELTASDLAPFGGASWSADPKPGRDAEAIDPAWLSRNAGLIQLGLGESRYGVVIPLGGGRDAPVMTAAGKPLVIDVAEIARRRNPAPPRPADLGATIEAQAALGGGLELLAPSTKPGLAPAGFGWAPPGKERL